MFICDIETVGTTSNCGVLSLAILHFDHEEEKHTIEYMQKNSLTLKFNIKEQFQKYERTWSEDTLAWWKKQSEEVRAISLYPSPNDISIVDGMNKVNEFIANHTTKLKDEYFWSRGQLDPIVLQDMCNKIGVAQIQPSFWQWRDVRTLIHFMYSSPRGYCDINYPYDPDIVQQLKGMKHDPLADIFLDVLMIYYGAKK